MTVEEWQESVDALMAEGYTDEDIVEMIGPPPDPPAKAAKKPGPPKGRSRSGMTTAGWPSKPPDYSPSVHNMLGRLTMGGAIERLATIMARERGVVWMGGIEPPYTDEQRPFIVLAKFALECMVTMEQEIDSALHGSVRRAAKDLERAAAAVPEAR